MFVDELQTINIKIYYRKSGHNYEVYSSRVMEKIYGKLSKRTKKLYDQYHELNVEMKELNWGDYNDLQEQSVHINEDGEKEFSIKKYKENKLENLIVSWDAQRKNSNGELVPVEVNKLSLGSLAPEIGEVILEAYEKEMEISEDDEKK